MGGRIYWETHLSPLLHMQGRFDEVAVELRGPDGRLPVLMSAVVHTDDDGRRSVDVALSRATERSRYERELLAARTAADRSADQLRALQATTAALSQGVGSDGVAGALVETAVTHLGAAAASVWLAADDGTLVRRATAGEVPADEPGAVLTVEGTDTVQQHAGGVVVVALGDAAAPRGTLVLSPRADPFDVGVLTAVGQQAGLALERAATFDQKASVAHELQRALLTTHLPVDHRFAVTTEYRPGVQALEVGGDWYDAFLLDDDVLAVAVGDVVGRGLHAATAMGQLRSAVRAIAGPGVGPAALLTRLDRFVTQAAVGFMATLAYAEIDLGTGRSGTRARGTCRRCGSRPAARTSSSGRAGRHRSASAPPAPRRRPPGPGRPARALHGRPGRAARPTAARRPRRPGDRRRGHARELGRRPGHGPARRAPTSATTCACSSRPGDRTGHERAERPRPVRGAQNTRLAISAGASSSSVISSSSWTSVSDAPAMSSDVQYSPT